MLIDPHKWTSPCVIGSDEDMDRSIEQALFHIHNGNAAEREQFITKYRPYILRAVGHICKSNIGWNDDEASIGLIAFNDAIDHYNVSQSRGKTFENFAFMVIRHRLIDEFRRNGKHARTESIDFNDDRDFDMSSIEFVGSLDAYEREQSAAELAQELLRYDEILQEYGVCLEELEECSPSHQDARIHMIQLAKQFIEHPELWEYLQRKKQLPIKGMLKFANVSKKTLERNRKYLIALILIFTYEEFERIRSAISFAGVGE